MPERPAKGGQSQGHSPIPPPQPHGCPSKLTLAGEGTCSTVPSRPRTLRPRAGVTLRAPQVGSDTWFGDPAIPSTPPSSSFRFQSRTPAQPSWLRSRALLPSTCHSPSYTGRMSWVPKADRGCIHALLSPKGPSTGVVMVPLVSSRPLPRASIAHSHPPPPVLSSQTRPRRGQNGWAFRTLPSALTKSSYGHPKNRKCQGNQRSGSGGRRPRWL